MQGSDSRMRRVLVVVSAAFLGLAVLAGCVDPADPVPTPGPTETVTPIAPPTPEPDPEINLEGTAGQNQAYFDFVNERLIESGGTLDGRAFIDNLVAAGYPKSEMEVTPDRTSINTRADSIQFSIRLNDTCLIGQYGNVGYTSTFAPVLGTGRCLVGMTRPIDW